MRQTENDNAQREIEHIQKDRSVLDSSTYDISGKCLRFVIVLISTAMLCRSMVSAPAGCSCPQSDISSIRCARTVGEGYP